MYKLEKIIAKTVSTEAETVKLNGMPCLVQNLSEEATVYIKEKRDDGTDATADNGWAIPAGGATAVPMTVRELSVIASEEDTDVRVLVLDVG